MVRGKQVSPPAPFRGVAFGNRWEGTTQTPGVNPAFPVTPVSIWPSPSRGGLGGVSCASFRGGGGGWVHGAGETGFPPSPLPRSGVWESMGRNNSNGRSESGLSSDACIYLALPLEGRVGRGVLR